nr:MAG TPA: hypothetical protein [Caudoviricetes sp.]
MNKNIIFVTRLEAAPVFLRKTHFMFEILRSQDLASKLASLVL